MTRAKTYHVICISNAGYGASLEARKVYVAVEDRRAAHDGLVRVIDESGEDYLYPAERFARIRLPRRVEEAWAAE